MPHVHASRDQTRVLDLLGLELEIVVNHLMGVRVEFGSSGRATHSLQFQVSLQILTLES